MPFGIISGSTIGGVCGAFYGLLCDIFFGKTIGINITMYLLIGISAGYFKNIISKDNQLSLVLMVSISTFLFEMAMAFVSCFLYNYDFRTMYFLKIVFFEEIYNIFLTYVFFWPLAMWGEAINRSKDSYYLLH